MSCKRLSSVLKAEYRAIARRWKAQAQEAAGEAGKLQKRAEEARQKGNDPAGFMIQAARLMTKADELRQARRANIEGRWKKHQFQSEVFKLRALAKLDSFQEAATPAKPRRPLAALCFSGGGIRSATFNLGVLQGLAWHGLLDQFDYLSTVSGGGFIGSWLMAWACRDGGLAKVAAKLKKGPASPLQPEPPEVTYLRDFSRYLSPRFSLVSADTWTLVTIYIRNLLLNWLVLIPLLLAALLLPRVSAAVVNLFPILEDTSGPAPDKAAPPQVLATVHSSTPGAKVDVVVTEPPQNEPASQPTTCPSAQPTPAGFGTAPLNYINLLYGLGLLYTASAFLFAMGNEPAANSPQFTGCSEPPGSTCARVGSWCWLIQVLFVCAALILVAEIFQTWSFWVNCLVGCIPLLALVGISRSWRIQRRFLAACLGPLILGAVLLSLGWAWDENQTKDHFVSFVEFLAVPMLGVTLAAIFFQSKLDRHKWAGPWALGWEIIATALGALAGGTLMWLCARLLEEVHGWSPPMLQGATPTAASGWETSLYVCLAVPLVLGSLGGGATVRIGVLSRRSDSTDEVREWWSRFGGWVLIASLGWLMVCALVLLGPGLLLYGGSTWARAGWAALGGSSGLLTIFLGKSGKTPATEDATRPAGPAAGAMQVGLALAAPTFICLVVAALSLATDGVLYFRPIALTRPPPCATGPAWHFAMVELFDDSTERDWQPFLGQGKCGKQFRDARSLSAISQDLKDKTQWGWFSAVDRYTPAPRPGEAGVRQAMHNELTAEWDGSCLICAWLTALAAAGTLASILVNLNRFSLHGTFRDRLVRAYLGASRHVRAPDEFTGFAEADNFTMAALAQHKGAGSLPVHVINMTLNLAGGGSRLSWQDRKAESFTVSPYFAGSQQLGYRRTRSYGGQRGITIGTALTLSGAAVSPNMGSHSSPVVAFLLTLFNVRLGAWLGNPGSVGDSTYQRSAPKNAALHVVAEALGLTDADHKYVYLSDGGHFENLGLYEMVRRRCRFIVVCDAGADPDYGFEDLANAVRKIRIDFGIPIMFEPSVSIVRGTDKDVAKGKYCATGRIKYSSVGEGDDGFLIYIKPAFYKKNEPIDVRGYAVQSEAFPQEPTADQFFTESQFESYRALGEHILDEIQGLSTRNVTPADAAGTLDEFLRRVEANLGAKNQDTPQPARTGG
jgi:hypothetical protein